MHGSAGESNNHSQKKPEFQTRSNRLKFRLSQKCWEEDYFFLSLFFFFSRARWPNVLQNSSIFSGNVYFSQPWIQEGERKIFSKRENHLFEY